MLRTQGPFTRSAARRAHAQNTRASVVMELIESNDDVHTIACAPFRNTPQAQIDRVCRACAEFFTQHSATLGSSSTQGHSGYACCCGMFRRVAECCVYPSGQARVGSNIRTVPRTPTRCEQAIIGRIAARGLARPSIGLLAYTYLV